MWISVKDRLPEVGFEILNNKASVLVTNGKYVRGAYYERPLYTKIPLSCRFIEYDGRLCYLRVTHWQPLPEPPKEDE